MYVMTEFNCFKFFIVLWIIRDCCGFYLWPELCCIKAKRKFLYLVSFITIQQTADLILCGLEHSSASYKWV